MICTVCAGRPGGDCTIATTSADGVVDVVAVVACDVCLCDLLVDARPASERAAG